MKINSHGDGINIININLRELLIDYGGFSNVVFLDAAFIGSPSIIPACPYCSLVQYYKVAFYPPDQ